jgi:hypothetical protein
MIIYMSRPMKLAALFTKYQKLEELVSDRCTANSSLQTISSDPAPVASFSPSRGPNLQSPDDLTPKIKPTFHSDDLDFSLFRLPLNYTQSLQQKNNKEAKTNSIKVTAKEIFYKTPSPARCNSASATRYSSASSTPGRRIGEVDEKCVGKKEEKGKIEHKGDLLSQNSLTVPKKKLLDQVFKLKKMKSEMHMEVARLKEKYKRVENGDNKVAKIVERMTEKNNDVKREVVESIAEGVKRNEKKSNNIVSVK